MLEDEQRFAPSRFSKGYLQPDFLEALRVAAEKGRARLENNSDHRWFIVTIFRSCTLLTGT